MPKNPNIDTVLSVRDLTRYRQLGWTYAQIAEHIGLSHSAVGHYAKQHLPDHLRSARDPAQRPLHCPRCDILFSPTAPETRTGLCLYCELESAGVNLVQWHESGAATPALRARLAANEGPASNTKPRTGQMGP